MIERLRKARALLKTQGAAVVARKILRVATGYAVNTPQRLRYQAFQRRLKDRPAGDIFVEIYQRNLWESDESRSGVGSEAAATQNLREHLPLIIDRFSIRSILDAPCGDFNWMRLVSFPPGVTYLGWDIVPDLILANEVNYSDASRRFAVGNLLTDPLPRADLMICRDCLFHFSHEDIRRALAGFVASGIPYLLTTTHIARDESTNTDIHTGYFRRIDLFSEPFCFPSDPRYRLDDFAPTHVAREICLWDRSQVQEALGKLSLHLRATGGAAA